MPSLAALRQQLAAIVAPVPQHAPGTGGGVSTGIAALDAALSDGGLPCGRLTEIVGPRGSGKTTLVREIVAQALADKRWVAYIDAARTLAPADWASLATTDRLWIVRPPSSGTGDGGRGTGGSPPPGDRPHTPGPWCADVLLRSGAFGLVVLDGAEALAPGVAVRLTRLARESHAAFVVMRDEEDPDARHERPSAPGSSRGTKRGLQRDSARAHRTGGVIGGAVRLRVQRQERQREQRQPPTDPRSASHHPDARWASLGTRLAGVQDRASRKTSYGLQDRGSPAPLAASPNASLIPRPPSPVPRPQFVLQVSVEKGGTHHVVEVACAIAVARRMCTDSQVPDRRGVATRNRRGDRVAPHGAGERNTTPPPDGGRGLAAPVDARNASGSGNGNGNGGTLAPKRRFATPAIGRDEFLLAPSSSAPGGSEWEGSERERPRPPVRRARVIGTGAPRKSPRPDPVHGRPGEGSA